MVDAELPALWERIAEGAVDDTPDPDAWLDRVGPIERLLPDGVATAAMVLIAAEDDDGRPVGYAWATEDYPAQGIPWLYYIWTDPAVRGRGVARTLLAAVEDELRTRGHATLGLNVFEPNARARRLYESVGFAVTARSMRKPL